MTQDIAKTRLLRVNEERLEKTRDQGTGEQGWNWRTDRQEDRMENHWDSQRELIIKGTHRTQMLTGPVGFNYQQEKTRIFGLLFSYMLIDLM